MREVKVLGTLGLALILSGCVFTLSIHPFYSDETLVFEPGLVGTWVEEKKPGENQPKQKWPTLWTFRRSEFEEDGKKREGYEVLIDDEGFISEFKVFAFRVGDCLFLDLYPQEGGALTPMYAFHVIAAHTVWRVSLDKGVLQMSDLDKQWLAGTIDAKKVDIAHTRLGKGTPSDTVILTAPTDALQGLLKQCSATAASFGEAQKLQRWKPSDDAEALDEKQVDERIAKLIDTWCGRRCLTALGWVLGGEHRRFGPERGNFHTLVSLRMVADHAEDELTVDERVEVRRLIRALENIAYGQ